jgi:hypothetical protein
MAVLDPNGNPIETGRETFEKNALNAFNVLGSRFQQLEAQTMTIHQQVVSLSFLCEYLITKVSGFSAEEFQRFIDDKLKTMQAANTEFDLSE